MHGNVGGASRAKRVSLCAPPWTRAAHETHMVRPPAIMHGNEAHGDGAEKGEGRPCVFYSAARYGR